MSDIAKVFKSGTRILALVSALTAMVSTASFSGDDVTFYPAPTPDAPYSPAVKVGDLLFLAGQLGRDENGNLPQGIEAQTHEAMKRITNLVNTHGSSMDRVVKCTVFLADIKEWGDFNTVYKQYFKEGHRPARSAFGIGGLGGGARVEVECIAAIK